MLFYKFQMDCHFAKNSMGEISDDRRSWRIQLNELSSALAEGIDGEKVKVFIHRARQNSFQMLVSVDGFKEMTAATLTGLFENFFIFSP